MRLINNKFLIFILVALLFINSSLVFLLFFNHKISIENKNNNYSLTYEQTKEFNDLLTNWKIFNKGVLVNGRTRPLNQIIIELTDIPQRKVNSTSSAILINSSVSYSITTLRLKIYISKQFLATESQISGSIIQLVVSKLYPLSHTSLTIQSLETDLLPIVASFVNNPQHNPFKVIRKK